jgi:hypothetical protein
MSAPSGSPRRVVVRTASSIVLILLPVLGTSACSSGPTTKAQVCKSFDELGAQLVQGNGVFGNPLFHKAGKLADVADRYEDGDALSSDAAQLHSIASSDSTDINALMNATTNIAALCGAPLGVGALLGQ